MSEKKPLSASVRMLVSPKPPRELSKPAINGMLSVSLLLVDNVSLIRSSKPLTQVPVNAFINASRIAVAFSLFGLFCARSLKLLSGLFTV